MFAFCGDVQRRQPNQNDPNQLCELSACKEEEKTNGNDRHLSIHKQQRNYYFVNRQYLEINIHCETRPIENRTCCAILQTRIGCFRYYYYYYCAVYYRVRGMRTSNFALSVHIVSIALHQQHWVSLRNLASVRSMSLFARRNEIKFLNITTYHFNK